MQIRSIIIGILLLVIGFVIGYAIRMLMPTTAPIKQPAVITPSVEELVVNNTPTTPTDTLDVTLGSSFENGAVSFKYPSNFQVAESQQGVRISHSVPYTYTDSFCNMKDGTGPTLTTFGDFSALITVENLGLSESIAKHDSWIAEQLQNNTLTLSEATEEVRIGPHTGYSIFMGAEGCGRTRYYFPLEAQVTVVVDRPLNPYLGPVNANNEEFLSIPGVIAPDEGDAIFEAMVASIQLK